MLTVAVILGVGGLAVVACLWALLRWWTELAGARLARDLRRREAGAGETIVMGPQPCLYRGASRKLDVLKGNGVICLTGSHLVFEKLSGRRLEIARSDIVSVGIKGDCKVETPLFTGGKQLVVHTADGNRVGFLLKGAERWTQALGSG